MDASVDRTSPPRAPAPAPGGHSSNASPALPPDAPLEMPVQSLDVGMRRDPTGIANDPVLLRRGAILVATALLTAFAGHEMYLVLQVAGLTLLEHVVLGLFVVLFAWVSFSFVINLTGFLFLLAGGRRRLEIDPSAPLRLPSSRTALLFPVYNEDPAHVTARLQAMHESLRDAGASESFHFFVLSDTTRPDVWIAEEAAFLRLRADTRDHERIFYRHRPRNVGRKAGNIADWVKRFGGAYEYMIVLDADSLMSGDTLVRLVDAMESRPQVGLIQTLPVVVNGSTVFARLQQFANRLYGPMLGFGLASWHGSEGNYWGHNAILRTRAFAGHAGLPLLRGRKPIGGEILSHDFVEAALMRRGGWAICIAPGLGGSFEESPPALSDYSVRDRRWCQGNLQHMGVLPARGLHPVSRLHLFTGIGAYVTAPLWLLFLLVGIVASLQAQFIRPEYFPGGFALFPIWPAQDPVRAAWVFAGTMALLLLPKLLAWLAMLVRSEHRPGFGGGGRSLASVLLETIVSGLMAPVMMLDQSVTVAAALSGRDVGWNVQRRDDGALPWTEVARVYAGHTVFGVLLAAAAYVVSWPLFLWMTPVIAGLLLAIPLAAFTANARLGRGLRRLGLLLVPEERHPPAILLRANELAVAIGASLPEMDAIARLRTDETLLAAHRAMIEAPPRRRGEVDVHLVVGMARLDDARAPEDVRELLSDRELGAVLADPRGFERLASIVARARGTGATRPGAAQSDEPVHATEPGGRTR